MSTIEAGEVFYTGFYRNNEDTGTQEFLESRYAIWLSKYLPYAGEYSYRQSSCPVKKTAKIEITQEIVVLEFPLNFHPADCFFEWSLQNGRYEVDYSKTKADMPIDGYQPDHHFDKNFKEISYLLGIKEKLSGYIRRALTGQTGFKSGEIIEFALTDYQCKKIASIADMPKTKDEFRALADEHSYDLETFIFGKA